MVLCRNGLSFEKYFQYPIMKRSISLLVLVLPFLVHAQSLHFDQKLTAEIRTTNSAFGNAVDITDSVAVIGSPEDAYDEAHQNPLGQAGSVSVFNKDSSGQWVVVQKICAPNRKAKGYFGRAVKLSGNRLAIGAFEYDNGTISVGSVFVYTFKQGSWQFEQQLFPSDGNGKDKFGFALDLDGNTLIVGAYSHAEDSAGNQPWFDAGKVYFFEFNNNQWNEIGKATPKMRLNSGRFGLSIAVFGNNAIIGSPYDGYDTNGNDPILKAGAVFHYRRNPVDGKWHEIEKIVGMPRGGEFGTSVTMNDSFMFVAAPKMSIDTFFGIGLVHMYKLNDSGTYRYVNQIKGPNPFENDNFGNAIDLNGNLLAIACNQEDEDIFEKNTYASTGSAYSYRIDRTTDSLHFLNKMSPPNSLRYQFLGMAISVAICPSATLCGSVSDDYDAHFSDYKFNTGSAFLFDTTCLAEESTASEEICLGDSIFFGSNYYKVAGLYASNALNEVGCDSTRKLLLSIYQVNTGVSTITKGFEADIVATAYQWLDCDNNYASISGANQRTFNPSKNGQYAVQITDGSCVDTSACYSFNEVGIETLSSNISIYPNPALHQVTVTGLPAGPTYVSVYDALGKRVLSTESNLEQLELDISAIQPGTYYLRVTSGISSYNEILIIGSD